MAKKRSRRAATTAPKSGEPGPKKGATADYRHTHDKRKNNPPAKIAAEGVVPAVPTAKYAYSPHRPPVLRFEPVREGEPLPAGDAIPELLAAARERPLTDEEARLLAHALRAHEPWLEWAEKREQHQRGHFEVDPVALHIHERVSAQAILKVAARQDIDRSLFADPEQEYHEAVQFYRHDIDWTNRLILGDSVQVMSSLSRRENLAGKVQMIYMDPPYGINYRSNFQPIIGDVDVKNRDEHLTREPEMVHAFRDTWHLGVHSYLSYLRERFIVARELLADTGSVFVQIGDDRSHLVRNLMDEVFDPSNFVAEIVYVKTTGSTSNDLPRVYDTLLWYRKSKAMKYRPVFNRKVAGQAGATGYTTVLLSTGERRPLSQFVDHEGDADLPDGAVLIASDNYTSQSPGSRYDVWLDGRTYRSEPGYWKTDLDGMRRILQCERLLPGKTYPGYCRRITDFECFPITNVWTDTLGQNQFGGKKVYATQTALKVLQRCICLTTDPGDLVLDPTSGSGTTAVVAERFGRRWIAIDSSRVAIATARHRLMVQRFPYYRLADTARDVAGGFQYNKLPHTMPSDIAQNTALDAILARYGPVLDRRLADLKAAIQLEVDSDEAETYEAPRGFRDWWHTNVPESLPGSQPAPVQAAFSEYRNALGAMEAGRGSELDVALRQCNGALRKIGIAARQQIATRLLIKQRQQGKRAISEGDRRRWLLPPLNTEARHQLDPGIDRESNDWYHWEVPFDSDETWPVELQRAVTEYRRIWQEKMRLVDECVGRNAEGEDLVDDPKTDDEIVRVSGPFTVEAVQPPEMSLGDVVDTSPGRELGTGFDGARDFLDTPDADEPGWEIRFVESRGEVEARNAAAYLRKMYELIRDDGVRFPNNRHMVWASEEQGQPLTPLFEDGRADLIHAEGHWMEQGQAAPLDGRVAVAFGPQYGPVTAKMVEDLIRSANRAGYDALVIAAFSFDGPAQAVLDEAQHPKLKIHMAHIRPDVNPGMDGLLKDPAKQKGGEKKSAAASQQLFSVFGQPRIGLTGPNADGDYIVKMEGVDIYDPVRNTIEPTSAGKVAAWFLDSDYDGRTFCITQAFFPDRSAWDKLAKALGGVIDEARFEAFSGTESLPFPPGKHRMAAVKVIDPRGNEVMKVVPL